MGAIARQLAVLVGSVLALYAVLLCATLLIAPEKNSDSGLDTGTAGSTIFMTEPKYAFLNRSSLGTLRPRMVLVGASNTVVGLRPALLTPLLPDREIDNLAVGGSNITQIAQVIHLVQEVQPEPVRQKTTFVIGAWYGLFGTDRSRWYTPERHPGDTDIDIERYRYGFYRRSDHGPVSLLPPQDLSLGVLLVHPLLVLDKFSRKATSGMRLLVRGAPARRTDEERNATVLTEEDKLAALQYWHGQMQVQSNLDPEQFRVLREVIGTTVGHGSKVILVDLPIPRWHAQRSPFYPSYVSQMRAIVSAFASTPGFEYIDMRGLDTDLDFSDEVHPKPRMTPIWAATFAQDVRLAEANSDSRLVDRRAVP